MARIALLTDIHGNREAFEAVYAAAMEAAVERFVVLGDLVGYGPDPQWVVDRVAAMPAGTIVLRGNHDDYAVRPRAGMTEAAEIAVKWTHDRLDAASLAYLAGLPFTAAEEDRLYVHASAREPASWRYIDDTDEARLALAATDAALVFCGHTHVPALFHAAPGKSAQHFRPLAGTAVPLSRLRRWVCVIGSVGQPRDRNPNACWGLLDTDERGLTMMRVPYDLDATMRKINEAGLPSWLARRLQEGR